MASLLTLRQAKKKDKVIPAGAATRYPEKILYDIKPRNYRAASTNAN